MEPLNNLSVRTCAPMFAVVAMGHVSDDDIKRSRSDPRFRQALLARNLEQLLGALHRLQHSANAGPSSARHLREGALVAVELADRIRAIDEQLGQVREPG